MLFRSMADDVKVKFGGDYSAVADGAAEAGKRAGTVLSSSFAEFGSSMLTKLGGFFALENIFEGVKEQVASAREYFADLNKAIRVTGQGSDDFQRVASAGKSVGVSLEAVGRSMGFFAKYMGDATLNAEKHGKVLNDLGFETKDITAGNIKASDVLIALAKEYDKTKDANIAAERATQIFGRSEEHTSELQSH